MKNLGNLIAGVTLMATCFLFSQTALAQAKPAGKPWDVKAEGAKLKSTATGADAVAAGKEIWAKECKSCHGAKGLGDGPKAATLKTSSGDFSSKDFQAFTDGELFYKTSFGRDEMPAYDKKLADEADRWALVNFMRTLKK